MCYCTFFSFIERAELLIYSKQLCLNIENTISISRIFLSIYTVIARYLNCASDIRSIEISSIAYYFFRIYRLGNLLDSDFSLRGDCDGHWSATTTLFMPVALEIVSLADFQMVFFTSTLSPRHA